MIADGSARRPNMLARQKGINVDLLLPDLRAEIMVPIDHDYQARVFYSKIESEADVKQIASAVISAGIQLAESRGFKLEFRQMHAEQEVAKDARKDPDSPAG